MTQEVFYEDFDSIYFFSGSSQNWNMKGYHFHKNYEIILFMCSGPTMSIGNRTYTIEKGDMFLINNKEYHKTEGLQNKKYTRYVLMFDPSMIEQIATVMKFEFTKFFDNRPENFIHKISLSDEKLERTVQIFEKIDSCIHSKDTVGNSTYLDLYILELLVHIKIMYEFFIDQNKEKEEKVLGKELEFKENIGNRERVEQIKEYISRNIHEKIELEDIANKFFINKYYLSHYFKKETGFSLSQYIVNNKISVAKAMLKKGNTVTDVALQLAFNSDSHFISTFKKITGTTPKKYAIEKRNQHS